MKRIIEIKNTELLNYGSELTDKIQSYFANTQMIINCGKASTRLFKTPENMNDFIRQLQLDYQSIKNNLDNNNNEIDNNISKSFLQSAD